jgi:YD repeat-containing protein
VGAGAGGRRSRRDAWRREQRRGIALFVAMAVVFSGWVVLVESTGTDHPSEPSPGGVSLEAERASVSAHSGVVNDGTGVEVPNRVTGKVKPLDVGKFTAPDRKVTRDDDGSYSMEVTAGPARVKRDGEWQELDGKLVERRDGRIAPKVGYAQVSIAGIAGDNAATSGPAGGKSVGALVPAHSDGASEPLVTLETDAGELGLSHPSATAVSGQVVNDAVNHDVVFEDALSGGRDLIVRALPLGVEELVVLPDAQASGTYDVTLDLPNGTRARLNDKGVVEFVDDHDEIVAMYAPGWAYDSGQSATQSRAETPVRVELLSQADGQARIRVSVDAAWLADPRLVYPVTIDPSFLAYSNESLGLGGFDTWTASDNVGGSWWLDANLHSGLGWWYAYFVRRSYLYFPTSDPHFELTQASLGLWQTGGSCDWTPTSVAELWTVNGNQFNWYIDPYTTNNATSFYSGCAQGIVGADITAIAKDWGLPGANQGIRLGSYECCVPYLTLKTFLSGNGGWIMPTLSGTVTRHDAQYLGLRNQSAPMKRLEGQGSTVPITVRNTGSDSIAANGQIKVSCHVKKLDGTAVTDCPSTEIPKTIGAGQELAIDALVPALDTGDYKIEWDLIKSNEFWYSWRNVAVGVDYLKVEGVNPFARGDNPYAKYTGGVNTATGTFFYDTTDVSVATVGPPLVVSRSYNHRDQTTGWFGKGWSSSYEITATTNGSGDYIIQYPDGRLELYAKKSTLDQNNQPMYSPPTGYFSTFTTNPDGTAKLIDKDQTVYEFDTQSNGGRLLRITDANGRAVQLDYSGGRLQSVTAQPSGRTLSYEWSDTGGTGQHVTAVQTNPVSRNGQSAAPLRWTYGYSGDLLTKDCDPKWGTGPNAKCEVFTYDSHTPSPRVTKIVRPEGNTAIELTYKPDTPTETADRVASRKDGTGSTWTFGYDTTTLCAGATAKTTATDPRGFSTVSQYSAAKRMVCHTNEAGKTHTYTYDPTTGFLSQEKDENDVITYLYYDGDAGSRGNVTRKSLPNDTSKFTYFTYDAKDHVTEVRDARSSGSTDDTYLTTNTYDAAGNRLSTQPPHPVGAAVGATTWVYADGQGATTGGSCPGMSGTVLGEFGGGNAPKGLMLCEQKPGQNPTKSFFDAEGHLRRTEDPVGLITEYDYDVLGVPTRETMRWTNPDQSEGVAVSETVYDELGQPVKITYPAVTNAVNGLVHQQQVLTAFDANDNRLQVTRRDVGGSTAPDADRVTSYQYDTADRESATNYLPAGGSMTREFDANGNVTAVTDQLGRRTTTSYTPTNRPDTITLAGADAGALPNAGQSLVIQRFGYDNAGRTTSTWDAEGRETRVTYDASGRVVKTDRYSAAGALVATLDEHTYDAAGNETVTKTGSASRVVNTTYYSNNLVKTTLLDPTVLKRQIEMTYDNAGRPVTIKRSINGGTTPTPEETRYTYDSASGLRTSQVVENGVSDLTTSYGYDARGLNTAVTDPRGSTTSQVYDVLGRPSQLVAPSVPVNGGAPERPTTMTGYNAAGEKTEVQDANGNVTATAYDVYGRKSQIVHPTYTPPGGEAITPTEGYAYDLVGNLTASTDRRGQTTTYTFDMLNRARTKIDPQATGSAAAVTAMTYDKVGNRTSVVDPLGIQTTAVYDARNRKTTETFAGSLVTSYVYDDLGNTTFITPPGLGATTMAYNAAGETTSVTKPGGATTTTTYDLAGRPLVGTDPLGRTVTSAYDLAGRQIQETQQGKVGEVTSSATTTYGYDANGNQTSVKSPRNFTTTFAYDGANRLTSITQPVAAGQQIVTSYGYDKNGNVTQFVDGNQHTTTVSYNPWNLPQTRIEPSTPGQEDASLRSYTNVYDAGGLATQAIEPGGVTVTNTYDQLGRLMTQAGSGGPDAPAVSKSFSYNVAGQMIAASAGGVAMNFAYNTRGLLTTTTGGAGSSNFTYDNAGRLTSRTDAAGTSNFGYDSRSNLTTETDGLTGQLRTNTWDNADQLTGVSYSPASPTKQRALKYDGLGRLTSDTYKLAGASKYATSYAYDADSNVTSQTITGTGVAGAGSHGYTYDQAGRLTSWTPPGQPTVNYGWDAAGNRIQAGSVTQAYDARNRLTSATTSLPLPTTTSSSTTTTSSTTTSSSTTSTSTTGTGNDHLLVDTSRHLGTSNRWHDHRQLHVRRARPADRCRYQYLHVRPARSCQHAQRKLVLLRRH